MRKMMGDKAYQLLNPSLAKSIAFLDLYLGYILVCTMCVSATVMLRRLWICAGKLWKLVSLPINP